MNSHRNSKIFAFLVANLILLSLVGTSAIAPFIPPAGQMKVTNTAQLLQFTSSGYALGFTPNGMYATNGSHALHVNFIDANPVQPQSDSSLSVEGKVVPLGSITYANLWKGVSLTYTASPGSIYTTIYTLAPGADAKNIRLRYNAPLTLSKNRTLNIAFQTGTLTESAPIAWQEIHGSRVTVDVSFQISGQKVSFVLGSYNPHYALTIDPNLTWNTFLGGSGDDLGSGIAVDGSGNVYVSGVSYDTWGCSPTSCTVRAYSGSGDAFVAKLDSSGSLIWNTFLGGILGDYGWGIAVDGSGNVYVTGWSDATWGCSSTSCTVRAYSGNLDAFAAKLNSSGNLIWNTFLGGNQDDIGRGIAVDGSGNVYVTGWSNTTWGNPVQGYTGGYEDAFAAKLNSSGSLTWNTFLGGIMDDEGSGIVVDDSGYVYVTGVSAASWGSPVRAYTSGNDAFAAKLNSSGGMTWNTFLGGIMDDEGWGIAVDGSGNVYVEGDSTAAWGCSPTSCTARAYSGNLDAFAAKLNSSGNLIWNTFLGGGGKDVGGGIAMDGSGNVYVLGYSYTTWGSPERAFSGGMDAFVTKLDDVPNPWTIMVYLDGDNSLDSNYLNVMNQLEDAANNPNVNVVIAWDRPGSNDSAYYKVKFNTDLYHLATYTEGVDRWGKGDLNMSAPTTLSDFIQWARTNYPAEHYALFISDHGTGLKGTALDQSSGNKWLTVNDLGNALSTATSNGTNKLDVVFADSCLMGMIEDAYQIRSYANLYIASENQIGIPSIGSRPYSNYVADITSSTTAHELAMEIVNNYAKWVDDTYKGNFGYTLSAVDLSKIDPLVSAVSNLGTVLRPQIATYATQIQSARNAAQKFDSTNNKVIDASDEYVDLADLASKLMAIPDTNVQNAAQSVIDAEGAYVIANTAKSGSLRYPYPSLDPNHVYGVSIFFPAGDKKRSFYTGLNLDFANGTVWGTQSNTTSFLLNTLDWGPLLVDFVENVTPAAADDPNPPDLSSPIESNFTISGNVGLAGATLSFTDGTAMIATADGSGNYSFSVSYNWSGTVTPSSLGYTFSPDHIDYTDVLADQNAQNYTATSAPTTITQLYPTDGSQTCRRPQVGAELIPSDVSSALTLTLDDNDVTAAAVILQTMTMPFSRTTLIYTPTIDLGLGVHQAVLTYTDGSGPQIQPWSFMVTSISCQGSPPSNHRQHP